MSLDDVDRPVSGGVPATKVVHRRWVLSTRAGDGRPLLVREDKVVHPNGFARARRTTVQPTTDTTSGTPALT